MNRVFFTLSIGWFLFSGLGAFASGLVQFPTGSAAWTVDVTSSPKLSPPQPLGDAAVVKVEVTQNDKFSCNLVSFANGMSRPSWGIIGTNLILTEDPDGTAFLTPTSGFFFIPYLPTVFDWLSPELLKEKNPINYQGKSCLHYEKSTPFKDLQGRVIGTRVTEAWIESKTLLPVALDDGATLASFTFHPPPATPLVLPEKFNKILTNYTAVMGLHPNH